MHKRSAQSTDEKSTIRGKSPHRTVNTLVVLGSGKPKGEYQHSNIPIDLRGTRQQVLLDDDHGAAARLPCLLCVFIVRLAAPSTALSGRERQGARRCCCINSLLYLRCSR